MIITPVVLLDMACFIGVHHVASAASQLQLLGTM